MIVNSPTAVSNGNGGFTSTNNTTTNDTNTAAPTQGGGGSIIAPTSALSTGALRKKSFSLSNSISLANSTNQFGAAFPITKMAIMTNTHDDKQLKLVSQDIKIETYVSTSFVTINASFASTEPTGVSKANVQVYIPDGGCLSKFSATVGNRVLCVVYVPTANAAGAKSSPQPAQPCSPSDGGSVNTKSTTEFSCVLGDIHAGDVVELSLRYFYQVDYVKGKYTMLLPYGYTLEERQVTKVHGVIYVGARDIQIGSSTHDINTKSPAPGVHEWEVIKDIQTLVLTPGFMLVFALPVDSASGYLLVDNSTPQNFCLVASAPQNISSRFLQREFVILMDISTSMTGRPLRLAKKAVVQALQSMKNGDVINVIAFSHVMVPLSVVPVNSSDAEAVADLCRCVEGLEANGGTNILEPLRYALQSLTSSQSNGRLPVVMLITDGAVEDEREICQLAKQFPRARVLTLGIGAFCNAYFLKMLATQGRGVSLVCHDVGQVGEKVNAIIEAADKPLLTDVRVNLEGEIYPNPPPDVYASRPLFLAGTLREPISLDASLTIIATDATNTVITLPVTITQVPPTVPLDVVSARARLDDLTARSWLLESRELEDKATQMSCYYGLSCPYTTPVTVETSVAAYAAANAAGVGGLPTTNGFLDALERNKTLVAGAVAGTMVGATILVLGFGSIAATLSNLANGASVMDAVSSVSNVVDGAGDVGECCSCECCASCC